MSHIYTSTMILPSTTTPASAPPQTTQQPFILPPAPEGRRWHAPKHEPWSAALLPPGYRPALVGEAGPMEVSPNGGLSWVRVHYVEVTGDDICHYRTTAGLP